ncbi:GPW/gp25 family protein [Flavobacterium aquiphilum]|uniref:GPW/gp25 family protein n=1 Tax=Flavobacterium aquiphilum TaxID=3003261 RepID=UPI002480C5C1|nr:GPW/gp25 family protein [Flavobacterium aquiphilum]
MDNETFIGTGWSFPPTFNPISGSVETVDGATDINQSLQILLGTKLEERILRSDFGCNLSPMLFENITVTLLTKIRGIVKIAILKYEPRIDLNNVSFASEETSQGLIKLEIDYTIRTTNSRHNYVYPFYLEEGTYIK